MPEFGPVLPPWDGSMSVSIHVKDAPVFVSDVTESDVPGILDWLQEHVPPLAERFTIYNLRRLGRPPARPPA